MSVVDAAFDHPLKIEEEAAAHLAGGIANHGYQCGMLWGAALAAGAQAYRLLGPGALAETAAILTTQRLVEAFRNHTKQKINCVEITGLNLQGKSEAQPILKFILKGGPIFCFRLAAKYAQDTYDEITRTFTENHSEAPESPVSCASMLAEKMGASEMHTVMAAGFAGGIGLSGAACGALGAAVWITVMNDPTEKAGGLGSNPRVNEVFSRFASTTGNKFACSEIVGRRFEDVEQHASYLRDGGCAQIIQALAA